jgi:glycosyltransferase involved in cell wall biosynthesis
MPCRQTMTDSVAILIPAYDSARYLPGVIESALRQTRAAEEIIVIDDGSTDATGEVCTPFVPRVRYVRQENGGVSTARNHGATLSTSRWFLFLDSDDQLLPHAVEALLDAVRRESCGVAYGRVIARGRSAIEDRLHGLPSAAGDPPQPTRANFKRAVITTPGAAIVRRDVFEKAGGFVPGYEPMEDRDFWMKCGMLTRFAFCDTVVLDKTFREGSAGTQIGRRIRSGLRAQLAFLDWCRERDFDTAFIGTTVAGIVDQALREALWHRRWEILEPLRAQADALGVRSYWYHRAGWQLRALRLLGLAK